MKRFLLLAAACCFLLASCSSGGVKPTGDPEKDAKALMDFQTQKTKEMTDALSHLKLSKAGEIGKEMDHQAGDKPFSLWKDRVFRLP